MKRFKNILVVCESEAPALEPALERAGSLARLNGAELTLIDVVEAEPGELARLFAHLPGRKGAEVEDAVLDDHRARLEDLAAPLRAAGHTVRTTVQQGTAFIRIIQRVLRDGHDLVLKPARPPEGLADRFMGADLHLMRKCPCPVWIIKDAIGAQSRHILAAVDPDPADTDRNAVNQTVMDLATTLAERDGARLDVVNVWRLPEEVTLRSGRFAIPAYEVDRILDAERRKSAAALEALTDAYPDPDGRREVFHVKGLPGEVIPSHVARRGIDTLVMGTLGRSGVKGFFMGNTAETILGRVSCSLVTVKPPRFVSPVELDG